MINLEMLHLLLYYGVTNFLQFDVLHSKNGYIDLEIFQFCREGRQTGTHIFIRV